MMRRARVGSAAATGRERAGAFALLIALAAVANSAHAQTLDVSKATVVDLTHPFNAETVYWPSSPSGFSLMNLVRGQMPGGWFYASGAFAAPEHGGTHLDAPVHFHENGQAVEQIPLDRLIGPAVVVDVSARTAGEPDYEISAGDLTTFETIKGPIVRGTIVLFRTGWSSRWPDRAAYLGDDTPGATENLHFPGLGEEAARILAEKGVAAIGIDTASLDPGKSQDFRAHRILAKAGIPGFENLNIPDSLPNRGITVVALPMKIEGGSGAPLRAVALVSNTAASTKREPIRPRILLPPGHKPAPPPDAPIAPAPGAPFAPAEE